MLKKIAALLFVLSGTAFAQNLAVVPVTVIPTTCYQIPLFEYQAGSTVYVSGPGNTCVALGTASGGDSITSPNSTLSVGGTSTATTIDINLAHANTWTALQTFGTNISIGGVTAAGATGTSNVVFSNSPTLVTPALGTPSAINLSNATAGSLPIATLAAVAANTTIANVTGGSAAPTAASIPAGVQYYTLGTGYSTATAAQLPGYVADVTFTISSSTTINANSCSPAASGAGTSVTMTGLVSTQALAVTPNADITNTTGWGNPAAGVLYITVTPGSGAFTYHVCNNTSSNITTGGSATFNVGAK